MLILLLLPLLGATGTALLHPGAPSWSHKPLPEGHVNQATIDRWHTEILWVDSRSREAYEADHITGALAYCRNVHWCSLNDLNSCGVSACGRLPDYAARALAFPARRRHWRNEANQAQALPLGFSISGGLH